MVVSCVTYPGTSISGLSWFFAAVMFAATSAAAEREPALSGESTSPTRQTATQITTYDIPAQALDSALDAYIKVSGAQLLYETDLTTGRRSAEVRGQFAPAQALQALLMGTGLVARRTDVDAVSIVPASMQSDKVPVTAFAQGSRFVDTLQANVVAALCGHTQTRPGGYKIAFELWIGQTGDIQSSALIGSSGDPSRDAAIVKALQDIKVDAPLPIGMPQPIIMSIRQRASNDNRDCLAR